MRRIRAIKRRRMYFLNAIFFASALLFYEAHAGMFFKEFAKTRLREMLPEGSRVEIGSVRGGILKNLLAKDVTIYTGAADIPLKIEEAGIDYRVWYPFLRKMPSLPSHFRIMRENGYVEITVDKKEDGVFLITGVIRHIKISGMDIVGKCKAVVKTGEKGVINSRATLKNMIINYTPFEGGAEAELSYDRGKGELNITGFKVGDEIEGRGRVATSGKNDMFLKLTVTDLDLKKYFSSEEGAARASGIINAKFTLSGPIKEARFTGHIAVGEGSVIGLKFDSIIANLKGKLPVIAIVDDSRIIKEDDHMCLSGVIDFSKLKDKKAFEGVRLGPGENFFAWEGWNVTQASGRPSVVAEKCLEEDFRLSFKSYTEDKEKQEEEEKHFFGIEHKMKF